MREYIINGNRFTTSFMLVAGLLVITATILRGSLPLTVAVVCIPFIILYMVSVLKKPYIGLMTIFILNYFLNAIFRYSGMEGLSVIMDVLMAYTLLSILCNYLAKTPLPWKRINNPLLFLSFVWLMYTALEVFNPTALFTAWVYTRGTIYYFSIIVFLTALLFNKVKDISNFLFLLSVFTLIAIAKVFWQKWIGFDLFEIQWLNEGNASTHLIGSGTRYFSIFTDAGNFGSNMGFAMVVYSILAFYTQGNALRIYYFCVALLACYAMTLSGTRGAIIVPLGGIAMYVILSKNIYGMVAGSIALLFVYFFFAFTYIGQSNPQISRMRTAFRPGKDASFNVRIENQKKFAAYLKNKPFGEGAGLAGVNARKFSIRYTTSIPTDSHYVSIWVQFGIVGICLYLAILLVPLIWGGYMIMFKIKNQRLKGMLIAINCGLFGIMLSAYGNNFFGQFPTAYIVYICQTFLILGKSYDEEAENAENNELERINE